MSRSPVPRLPVDRFGQVENQVGTVRRRLFTPRRRATDLSALNEALSGGCLAWAQTHRHPTFKDKTVREVFEVEQFALLSVPQPFDGYREQTVRVGSTSMVNFDRNRYSVACLAVGKTVQLRCYADELVMMHEGHCIGRHRRCFKRDPMIFDPGHYLPVLTRKPGALRNGAPFRHWDLPIALRRTWQTLKRYPDWDRQFVSILSRVPTYGMEAVSEACDQALMSGSVSADVVLNLLSRSTEQSAATDMEIPTHLQLKQPPVADCNRV